MTIKQTAQQYMAKMNEGVNKYFPTRMSKIFAAGGSLAAVFLGGTLAYHAYSNYDPRKSGPESPVEPQKSAYEQVQTDKTNQVSALEETLELPGIKPEINRDDVWGVIVRKN